MTANTAPFTWVGQPRERHEDARMVRGRGQFTDDVARVGALHLAFVRSPIAAGRILSIDTSDALRIDGVRAVLTAVDLGETELTAVLERDGFVPTSMPMLAFDHVRYVGEPIAVIAATDAYAAEDGAEHVFVDIEPLEPITTIDDAAHHRNIHEAATQGTLVDLQMFEHPEVESLLNGAHLTLDEVFTAARLNAAPMECRATLAEIDERSGQLVLHTSTQVPHQVRSGIAQALGMAENAIRVIAPDVGGGFGLKCVVGREEVLTAAVARHLGQTVRWSEDRRDSLMASFSGHEQRYGVRAGFTEHGVLVGIAVDVECDIGAYSAYPFTCGVEPLMACTELPGVYKVGAYSARGRGYATNKAPTAPYRGVSRPQIVLVMERLMEKAATALNIDPIEIRRRNLIAPTDFPYTGPNLITYEPGSYLESLDRCDAEIDRLGWRTRTAPGFRYGLGICCFSERSAYGTTTMGARKMGMTPGYDVSHITMDPTGSVTVTTGTCGHGQGHETTFAQIVADELGIDPADVRLRQGDTDISSYGWGTFASRSLVIGGGAALDAAGKLAESLKIVAAAVLEANPEDVRLADGQAWVDQVSVPISELARKVHFSAHEIPDVPFRLLEARGQADPDGCFSNATHAALVRVDEGTGEAHVLDYIVVEDCGVVVNPLIVDGQVRGGVAQGIGAALYERLSYDEDGQPQSATFMDYLVPTACEIPDLHIFHLETPNEASKIGAKGMGEGGAIGAPTAVLNAVNDALGSDFDMLPVLPSHILAMLATEERT
ncbi:MAG: xanthine dehydrogenase family protein molybdopterin-binding subunit [Antricoccus sp.]